MTARHYYEDAASAVYTDITEYVRLYTLDVTMRAEEGAPATSTITIDDPNGELDLVGLRDYRIYEDTATGSNTNIYAGFLAERKVSRGPYRTGLGRVWECSVVDINSYLGRRILTNTVDANRPAETDVARVQWLMDTWQVVAVSNEDYLFSSPTVPMDAVDYRGQSAADVLDDCAQQSGKNYFLWFNDNTDQYGIWYGRDSIESHTSPFRLSNDLDDIDGVWTFAIFNEGTSLSRDPSRVYSGVRVEFDGGVVFEREQATVDAFRTQREVSMPAPNVKSEAKATDRARRYLVDFATEEDIITTSFLCPPEKQGFLQAGMRVQFKATHLPGFESFIFGRVISRQVEDTSEEFYKITVDIAITGPIVDDGGIVDPGPPDASEPIATLTAMLTEESNLSEESTEECFLYFGATYRAVCTVDHNSTHPSGISHVLVIALWAKDTYDPPFGTSGNRDWNQIMGSVRNGDPETAHTEDFSLAGPEGDGNYAYARLQAVASTGTNADGSTVVMDIYYLSGPDPRFT